MKTKLILFLIAATLLFTSCGTASYYAYDDAIYYNSSTIYGYGYNNGWYNHRHLTPVYIIKNSHKEIRKPHKDYVNPKERQKETINTLDKHKTNSVNNSSRSNGGTIQRTSTPNNSPNRNNQGSSSSYRR